MPVTLYSEDGRRRWVGKALLDTGAQFGMLHPSVIAQLGLVARGERDIDPALGPARARAFLLRIQVADIFDDVLSALESPSRERVVLGRQFLMRTRLESDWGQARFSIVTQG